MRSIAFLLGVGLFGVDSALAGPCKPQTSTTDVGTSTSIDPITQSGTATAGETSVVASSKTLTETIATTLSSETTTATIIPTSETETTTVVSGTTVAIVTASSETETTTTAESTTTAPIATPTFTIVGGGGSVNGSPIKGIDQDGSIMLFNPERGSPRIRTFILDPDTGRLRDKDTGVYVCAYYGLAESPSDPAYFGFCQNGNTGPGMVYDYLTCEIVNGKLACTTPKASCSGDGDEDITCVSDPSSGLNNQFYYKYDAGNGDYLYISSGSPSSYTPVDIVAQDA
ncbi:hypothetical protein FPSE_00672 [Fusarium pseudograminearum CS3096]|uniref:Uncharacterized protein n=1 Tax=Fusarium pseudograminearum (strain CS3096) TaxID=1028729 RepID=K3V1H0_FUSPC|nr:hypothetical protein FPSE_00672 [Fusarium pseudograminearum CS3096]EKJ79071.1 hypothetical protein FPSE_00672 [Fusarium pseudograminearum CS3096]